MLLNSGAWSNSASMSDCLKVVPVSPKEFPLKSVFLRGRPPLYLPNSSIFARFWPSACLRIFYFTWWPCAMPNMIFWWRWSLLQGWDSSFFWLPKENHRHLWFCYQLRWRKLHWVVWIFESLLQVWDSESAMRKPFGWLLEWHWFRHLEFGSSRQCLWRRRCWRQKKISSCFSWRGVPTLFCFNIKKYNSKQHQLTPFL